MVQRNMVVNTVSKMRKYFSRRAIWRIFVVDTVALEEHRVGSRDTVLRFDDPVTAASLFLCKYPRRSTHEFV